jgi:hypothetical protein
MAKSAKQLKDELEKSILDSHFLIESKLTPNNKREKVKQILRNQITIMELLEKFLLFGMDLADVNKKYRKS